MIRLDIGAGGVKASRDLRGEAALDLDRSDTAPRPDEHEVQLCPSRGAVKTGFDFGIDRIQYRFD